MNQDKSNDINRTKSLKDKSISIAGTVAELTHINTRCFFERELVAFFSPYDYPECARKITGKYLCDTSEIKDPISCVTFRKNYTVGVINMDPVLLFVGPIVHGHVSESDVRKTAEMMTDDPATADVIVNNLKGCVTMSVYSFVPLLLNIYKMLHFNEISYTIDAEKDNFILTSEIAFLDNSVDEKTMRKVRLSDFFNEIISAGDVEGMKDWLETSQDMCFCPEVLDDSLRNAKNSFLIGSTLASQSAMRGGLDMFFALQIHQKYIRLSENSTSEEEVMQLLKQMFLEYTEMIRKNKDSTVKTELIANTLRYIRQHLYSVIRTEDIAKTLYVSRGHHSAEFRNEMGIALSDYIRNEKVDEAKKLLKATDKPLAVISEDLGFSSQSYFTKVFKNSTGKTPNEYRKSR